MYGKRLSVRTADGINRRQYPDLYRPACARCIPAIRSSLAREVRRDAEHSLNNHQLPAAMHLVFLGALSISKRDFIPGSIPSAYSSRSPRKASEAPSRALAYLSPSVRGSSEDLRLCVWRLQFCLQLVPEPEEIEANQRGAVLDRMDLLRHAHHHRNAASLRRTKPVFLFRDVLGNFDRIVADHAERLRELSCSIKWQMVVRLLRERCS
jgi:hypothetical protein